MSVALFRISLWRGLWEAADEVPVVKRVGPNEPLLAPPEGAPPGGRIRAESRFNGARLLSAVAAACAHGEMRNGSPGTEESRGASRRGQ